MKSIEIPNAELDLKVDGAVTVQTVQEDHGILKAELLSELPLAYFLYGYRSWEDFQALDSVIKRRKASKESKAYTYLLPASIEAIEFMVNRLIENPTSNSGVETNYLASKLADTPSLSFNDLRTAYKRAHPKATVKSTDDWLSKSPEEHKQSFLAYGEIKSATSSASKEEVLLNWLVKNAGCGSLDQFNKITENCLFHDHEGQRTYLPSRAEEQQALVLSVSSNQERIFLSRKGASWIQAQANLVANPKRSFNEPYYFLPIQDASVKELGTASKAYQELKNQLQGKEDIRLEFNSSPARATYEERRSVWTFSSLSEILEVQESYQAEGITDQSGFFQPGYHLNTKKALIERAKELGLKGYTTMSVEELRVAVASKVIEETKNKFASLEKGFIVVEAKQPNRFQSEKLEGAIEDNLEFEALICHMTPEGLVHPELSAQPSRLKQYHPWVQTVEPINPFKA